MEYIPAPGNLGDAVIVAGIPRFVGQYPGLESRVLFRGGAFEPHADVIACLNQVPRSAPLTVLPSSFGAETAAIIKQFPDHEALCREQATFAIARAHGLNAALVPDLAFGLNYSRWKVPGEGVLRCFRGDIESATNFRPEDNRDLSLERQGAWTMEEAGPVAEYFINEISKYAEVHTDRLHVAIVATLLDKRVKFYSGLGTKNAAMYEQSLKPYPNISFHPSSELATGIPIRAMVIHQGSRMDRKDNVLRMFKDVGNCGVLEALAPDWGTPADRAVRGCSFSHLLAVKWHLAMDVKWLLVLEDDAVALPAFRDEFLKLDPAEIPQDCLGLVIGGDCENFLPSDGKFMRLRPPFWGSHAVVYNMDLIRRSEWLYQALFLGGIRQLGPDTGSNGICYESLLMLSAQAVGQQCYRMRNMSFTTTGGFSARSQTDEPPRDVALKI